tara:strand:- start:272 stop:613 length:342 start_codon:yes stop_codon:yes gene_type:complete
MRPSTPNAPLFTPLHNASPFSAFRSPPNDAIGERPCINGERCLAKFIAQVRYGGDTDKAFVCKEFLLPDQHSAFLAGKGLPQRRGKCLLCTRYFQHYTYILVRKPLRKRMHTP